MLKINETEFKIKFTEIHIRQRMYQGNSYLTLLITTEFFPTFVDQNVVSGAIEVKLDIKDIHSLDELEGKSYQGEIGNVTISVQNDGVWEHQSQDCFEVNIQKRHGRELEFTLLTDCCQLQATGTLVSLYTTNTSLKELKKQFDLSDFYEKPLEKEIGNHKIYKYYVKE